MNLIQATDFETILNNCLNQINYWNHNTTPNNKLDQHQFLFSSIKLINKIIFGCLYLDGLQVNYINIYDDKYGCQDIKCFLIIRGIFI